MECFSNGRVSQSKMTAVFRSSKERIEITSQIQRGGTHALANEHCFLDAEHSQKNEDHQLVCLTSCFKRMCEDCKLGLHERRH